MLLHDKFERRIPEKLDSSPTFPLPSILCATANKMEGKGKVFALIWLSLCRSEGTFCNSNIRRMPFIFVFALKSIGGKTGVLRQPDIDCDCQVITPVTSVWKPTVRLQQKRRRRRRSRRRRRRRRWRKALWRAPRRALWEPWASQPELLRVLLFGWISGREAHRTSPTKKTQKMVKHKGKPTREQAD